MHTPKPQLAVAARAAPSARALLTWALPLLAATLLAMLTPSPAAAQKLYRCGNNFSQVPCDKITEGKPMAAAATPEVRDPKKGVDVCAQAAMGQLGGNTVGTVETSKPGPAAVIQYANQPVVTRTLNLTLQLRDTQGVRLGSRSFTCQLSEDEQRVLQIR